MLKLLVLPLLLVPIGASAHRFADVITSASESFNPLRACDFDRDGAVNDSKYCRCNNRSTAGPGNYSGDGSAEFCGCNPAVQHCNPDGNYDDGRPRFRWTLDCNDFDANRFPQICQATDCDRGWASTAHCAGSVVDADADGDGHHAAASGGGDCDDQNPAIHPGAADVCGDNIDADCDGLDCAVIDADHDGWPSTGDCDDHDANVHPGAVERCGNGVDDDCADGDRPCVADLDHDGFDDVNEGGDDCDDLNSGVHPGAMEVPDDGIDQDCDGTDARRADVDTDGDGFEAIRFGGGDCDDTDPNINPAALDLCGDDIDQNCDGADRLCPATADRDQDGHVAISGGGDDCDDLSSEVHPNAPERCGDGVDQDCDGEDRPCENGLSPEADPTVPERTTNSVVEAPPRNDCQQAHGRAGGVAPLLLLLLALALGRRARASLALVPLMVALGPNMAEAGCLDLDNDGYEILWFDQCGQDCNDLDPNIHPDAPEVCADGIDNNCDGQVDEGCDGGGDADGDGVTGPQVGGPDCDDDDPNIFPGAPELCGDDVDQDCDGRDALCVVDADQDGVAEAQDCDDSDPTVRPGAPEVCGDGVDQDCDGEDLACIEDADGDGQLAVAMGGDDCDDYDASTYAGAPERCGDARDQDCDGHDTPCDHDGDGVPMAEDCNDFLADISPNAEEICGDGIDQDCDGQDLPCPAESSQDNDGDGHIAVAFGGDDCQDFDRARHPSAVEICGDGIDQDCDGVDLACAPPASHTGDLNGARTEAPILPAGYQVPETRSTSHCATQPGRAPVPWAALLLLVPFLVRRRWLALSLVVGAAGCAPENPTVAPPTLDPALYAAAVDPILARGCSTLSCHGNDLRPMRLYSVSKLRLDGDDAINTELTDAERCANLWQVEGFATLGGGSLVLTKPLGLAAGGAWHAGGYLFTHESPEAQCLTAWLNGATMATGDDGAPALPSVCVMDWNLNTNGEPAPLSGDLTCAR